MPCRGVREGSTILAAEVAEDTRHSGTTSLTSQHPLLITTSLLVLIIWLQSFANHPHMTTCTHRSRRQETELFPMVHNTLSVHKIASFTCPSTLHMPCTSLSRARLLLRRARLDCACALLCPLYFSCLSDYRRSSKWHLRKRWIVTAADPTPW